MNRTLTIKKIDSKVPKYIIVDFNSREACSIKDVEEYCKRINFEVKYLRVVSGKESYLWDIENQVKI